MNNNINLGHLLPCTCGGGRPDHAWAAPPEVHFCNCKHCGAHVQDDSEDQAASAWNRMIRHKEMAA